MADVWQNVVAGAVVAAAIGYLVLRAIQLWIGKRGAGCHSCAQCPGLQQAGMGTKKPLVVLQGMTSKSRVDDCGQDEGSW